jgi:metallo-beta-lactamase family protein
VTSITFLGAAQTVTGSRHLLTTASGKRILIDAGLFQGRKELRLRNWEPWTAGRLDAVLLTHAHIDHTGFLPRLCAQGLVGRVLCTDGTRDLARLLLPDSGHLQEEEARYANRRGYSKHHPAQPLYTAEEAESAVGRLEGFRYDAPVEVTDGIEVTFHQAGHVLGSAFLDVRADGKRILFSGDLGRYSSALLTGPDDPVEADAMLLECTYGDRTHPPGAAADELQAAILDAMQRGGPLLIPAFAIGRTQEILFLWRRLEHEGRIPKVAVFVDSPMATDATPLYLKHPEDQSSEVRSLLARNVRPLQPSRLQFVRGAAESAKLLDRDGFFVVIAASGMVTGGRILAHLERRLPDPETTVLLVGYQAEETRGRRLLDGAQTLRLRGSVVPVRARIAQMSGFSAHGDWIEQDRWLARAPSPPGRIFLVHGEPAALEAQRSRLAARGIRVEVPAPATQVQLA